MAEGVASYGAQKLLELLSRNYELLQGVHEQVDELKSQTRMLESLLEDADAKKYESGIVRNFLEDVKDIVDDAEYIIESYLLKEANKKGIKERVKRLSCFLVDRWNLGSDIEGITKRISKMIAQMKDYGIQQIIYGDVRSLSRQERQRVERESRKTFPDSCEKDLVGLDESVEELVNHLVNNDNIQVISISEMGGIGKTTIAQQVFQHDIVRRHFDGFAWVCVTKEFTQKDIWQRILQHLRPDDGDIEQMDEDTLHGKLFPLLKTSKRYLIVLDDVWEKEDWDRIKDVFSPKGDWKMIITSRNEGVGIHADPTCFVFRPRILTVEEKSSVYEELEALGKKMLTYCGGLPLAIKVLGGLLAKKDTVPEWERVYHNVRTKVVGKSGLDDKNLDSVYRVLSLSYEDLSMQLKYCFLHLAHFPEDYKIDLQKLFLCWAAEGIITSFYDGKTIRESGENYLEELVRRNMVTVVKSHLCWETHFPKDYKIDVEKLFSYWHVEGIPTSVCHGGATIRESKEDYLEELVRRNMVTIGNSYSSWGSGYCQMHDIMRDVCVSKAKKEDFLQVIKAPTSSTSRTNAHTPSRYRRLVVDSGNVLTMLGHKNIKKVRSVLCFRAEENLWKESDLRSLPLLRVLDLNGAQFEGGKLPSSIGELVHLRFLSLRGACVSRLPSSLRNLKLLLYLNLCVNQVVHVPNILKEMLELRYLLLPAFMDDKTKLELRDLVNLEALWYFPTKHCSVADLLRMTRLRTLRVYLNGKCTSDTLSSSLRKLRNLEQFTLVDFDESRVYPGGDLVWDCPHLENLTLVMHTPRFVDQYKFPPYLAHICLQFCRMEEDPMPILKKLLHLKSVDLSDGCFVGRRMVCSKSGFPQLLALQVSKQEELEEWIVAEGSMPCLRTLSINKCKKLKELPDGLKYITCLKELKIQRMKKEWRNKLEQGGEDNYKVQHIPNVQYINCDDE